MEKIKFNNSRGLKIIANFSSVGSDKLIILAHGFTNDKSSDGRFDKLSDFLNKNNYDTLAIDFSGSGESDDDALTLENQVDDLKSAIDFALEKGYEKIGLFGNSFGTLSCLKNYRKEIKTMVLLGAITESMQYDWNEYFSKEDIMNDLERDGFFYADEPRKHKITKQTLMDFENIDQNNLVTGVNCPLLIIHGNNEDDIEELQLLERSERAIRKMPSGSRLEIIPGGRHGMREDWYKVIGITSSWLMDHM